MKDKLYDDEMEISNLIMQKIVANKLSFPKAMAFLSTISHTCLAAFSIAAGVKVEEATETYCDSLKLVAENLDNVISSIINDPQAS